MKSRLLLIALLASCSVFGQQTYIPDDNFELSLVQSGLDNELDDYVNTENIDNVTFLDVSWSNISDLTGIEDFTMLTVLLCHHNNISTLNLCSNTNLEYLRFNDNFITSIDLSNNINLTHLRCNNNLLTQLDISSNVNISQLYTFSNWDLECIQVWDVDYANEQIESTCSDLLDPNWILPCFQIDSFVLINCDYNVSSNVICEINLLTDGNDDGCVNVGDVLNFLLEYGQCTTELIFDGNNDGCVSSDDLLILLSEYGQCE